MCTPLEEGLQKLEKSGRPVAVIQLGAYIGADPGDPLSAFLHRYFSPASGSYVPGARFPSK